MVEVVVEVLVVKVVVVVVVVMVARGPQCHTACRFSPEATAPVKIAARTYDGYTVLPVTSQRPRWLPSICTFFYIK